MRTNAQRPSRSRRVISKTKPRRRRGRESYRIDRASDPRIYTVHVPLKLHHRGGRKLVVTPDGVVNLPRRARVDNVLVKALARAYRWQKLIENGAYANIAEIAKAEKINDSYVARVLRLTLLAPDIVEAILNGRHPPDLQIAVLSKPMPVDWERQRHLVGY